MLKRFVPLLACLLLCGCSPAGVDADAIAEHYAGLQEYSIQVTASTAVGTVMEFELRVDRSPEEDTVTILAPEGIAGITARIRQGSTALEYKGAVAETLLPGIPGFTPCDGVTGLLNDLAGATPASATRCRTESGESIQLCYSGRLQDGQQTEKLVWLDPDYRLQRAELFVSGGLVMTIQAK